MTRATRATRELACLALGHDDALSTACPSSDEELIAALVREVQALRVAAGIVEETPTDRAEQEGALDDALELSLDEWETGPQLAAVILGHLSEAGWRLVPAPRP